MLQTYQTLYQDGIIEIEIKKSRFICHAKRVTDELQATEFIQTIKKEHWKANHNCAAYLIGDNDEHQRAYDDGEPSGTAGVPMLEVLKKMKLKNVAVVVTRYFGGTKLGAGGLIRAYSKSVSTALQELGIVEKSLQTEIIATISYPDSGKLEYFLNQENFTIKDISYTEKVIVTFFVSELFISEIKEELTNLLNGQISFKIGDKSYCEKRIVVSS